MPEREAIVHWNAGQEPFRWRWGPLVEEAQRLAQSFRDQGIQPGEVCALIFRHHARFYPIYMAVSLAGALPTVLAYPNPRLHPDKFRQGLAGMAEHSGLDWLLTERALDETIRPLAVHERSTLRGLIFPLDSVPSASSPLPLSPSFPEEPCLLQHSSGTTGLQKGVMLSHAAVLRHVRNYGEAIGLNAGDKIVSWLPLYHDMGLIAAFHVPLAFGIPTIQLDPFEWVTSPVLLLEAITREHPTIGWLPNFAFHLMATRIHADDLEGVRLDSMRLLVNCSEPVRAASHDLFAARFAKYGLNPNCLSACYAMAETTFAVTQTVPGRQAARLEAARAELGCGAYRPAQPAEAVRCCVSSGRPIAGCEVRVVDDLGQDLAEGLVGELLVRSVSAFSGYRNQPELTAAVLRNGWYHSGDLGFCLAAEYYVIGRKKDLIILAGKNIYPEDVEAAVNEVPGVMPGRVVAFGQENPDNGTEQIVVIAETNVPAEEHVALQRRHCPGRHDARFDHRQGPSRPAALAHQKLRGQTEPVHQQGAHCTQHKHVKQMDHWLALALRAGRPHDFREAQAGDPANIGPGRLRPDG